MKLIMTSIIALLVANSSFADESKQVEKVVAINDVLISGSFSTNQEATVVVSGLFPNGCYSWKEDRVEHKSEFLHEVRAIALVYQGMCIMALKPFTKVVGFGQLNSGQHTLRFFNGDGTYQERVIRVD